MSGTPEVLTAPPDIGREGRNMDALSDVFAAVRLSGGVFLDAEFTAPWCVDSKVGPEEFPDGEVPAHLIAYHYVVAGQMFVQPHGDAAVRRIVESIDELFRLRREDSAPALRRIRPAGGRAGTRALLVY